MSEKVFFCLIAIACSLGASMGMAREENGDSVGDYVGMTMAENGQSIPGVDATKKLSRHKRYMAFPEGSSFAVSYCGTFGYLGDPQYIYVSWALNYGIAYELPNETWVIAHEHLHKKKPKPEILRRHRRDLYNKLEVAIDNMGYNGRQCVLRALCESTQYFNNKGSNMVEELVRTVFTLPKSKVLSFEHNVIRDYDLAHRKGRNKIFCPLEYPGCSFSLIEMALGTYSNPLNFM